MYKWLLFIILCGLFLGEPCPLAATFTVVTTEDAGAGSLRQAIIDANANPGPDVVEFNISPGGEKTITLLNASGGLPTITDPLTIDGTTQPGSSGKAIIEIVGASVLSADDGLRINSSNCVIRGLVINQFRSDGIEISGGGFNVVEGCILGLNLAGGTDNGNSLNGVLITNSVGNRIGGSVLAARNIISGNDNNGVRIEGNGSISNVVSGNIIGLDITGAVDLGNTQNGIYINGGIANTIGGVTLNERNIISGNDEAGVLIEGVGSQRNAVIGNYIGTSLDGGADVGNKTDGVRINSAALNSVGGVGKGNLISGNDSDGLEITGVTATNNFVLGNTIGLTATGTALANTANGVLITANASGNIVGASVPGAANNIAFNNGDAIYVQSGTNNTIRGNAMFSNGGLGIDLDLNGVTLNDAGDADTGANQGQNFPILISAVADTATTQIAGTLNSAPSAAFTIDFYGVSTPDAASAEDGWQHGEGQQYLGNTIITTDSSGNVAFDVTLDVALNGRFVTATVTDEWGNTSEFSPNVNAATVIAGATFTVTTTADSGAGSLRQAILDANGSPGLSRIDFNIPGNGPHTIAPLTILPGISNSVTLDGYTQPGASPNTDPAAFNGVIKIILSGASAVGVGALDGMTLDWPGTTIRGLNIVKSSGDGILIAPSAFLCAVEGCVIGITLNSADGHNGAAGIAIAGSQQNRIGGSNPAQRNVISGNYAEGIIILGPGSVENLIEGNNIGTTLDGLAKLGNSKDGIRIEGCSDNVIGGTSAGARNVISGNRGDGVAISGVPFPALNNLVQGNYIGTDVTGAGALGNVYGVNVSGSRSTIGGTAAGEANLIAFNSQDGIAINTGTNNIIRGNSIHSNSGIGINIDFGRVTANDVGDGDVGGNQRQNFPLITSALAHAATTDISSTLNSGTNLTYTIDFYANTVADPVFGETPNKSVGNGEGQQYLGSTNVTTDATGNVTFSVTLPTAAKGKFICATATDSFGNTSEFGPCLGASSDVPGQTFVVTTTADSGPGSFRQAILDANALFTASDTITFNIPGDGPHIISLAPGRPLPEITDSVTIDGYTQPGAAKNTDPIAFNGIVKIVLSGTNLNLFATGLSAQWSDVTIRGLNVVGFSDDGIELGPLATRSAVEGCLIGIGLDGTRHPNSHDGIWVNTASNVVIGGQAPAARNVISGNGTHGVEIYYTATKNFVIGNLIGLAMDGVTRMGNRGNGLYISGGRDNTIGGPTEALRNVISGNLSDGVYINGASGNSVLGNYIGSDVSGTAPMPNTGAGILVTGGHDNRVGGAAAGEGNLIAFNTGDGVTVYAGNNSGTNNAIRANVIFRNNDLGIDLANNGVSTNDFGDGDKGANNLQNYPVLTGATATVNNTSIQGSLNSKTNTTYAIDFYSNHDFESAGNYEGEKYLGSASVTTDASGNAVFDVVLNGGVNGRFITATATDPGGNTSEFSRAIRAESTIPAPTLVVTTVADSGAGSLRQALMDAGNFVSSEPVKINFDIPGAGPHYIAPIIALPVPTEAVAIDGYSQPGASPNTLAKGNDAILKIHLSGSNVLSAGLRLTNSGNIVRGLSIIQFNQNGLEINGNSNRVEGCFIGLDSGGAPHANSLSGIRVGPVNVLSNSFGGRNNFIGGSAPAARNVISGNSSYQVQFDGGGANIVQGNYIGTTPSGDEGAAEFASAGIYISSSHGNLIGGAAAGEGNVISGASNGNGITIFDLGISSTRVVGNIIGADPSGAKPAPNKSGIVANASGNLIGGVNAGEANLIAFNTADGVNIVNSGTNNTARGNTIFSNGGLAINLGFDSANPNDEGDADTGPNNVQNYPVITAATITPAETTIATKLNSLPNRDYIIDFYANVVPDQNGYSEAKQYLGSTTTTTAANGNSAFTVTFPTVAAGRFIVATATDPDGNTSEISSDFEAASTSPGETFIVTNTNDSGPGSLRQAILDNNVSLAGANNIIEFNIPGPGPHTITPTTAFPAITHAATFDGFSQPGAQPNTLTLGDDSIITIQIDGNSAIQAGLNIQAPGCVIRGFSITHFGNAIRIASSGAQITGCWLGLSAAGVGANLFGIYVGWGADTVIGGPNPADRNAISGNVQFGIYFEPETSGSKIQGNYIGVAPSGLAIAGNAAGLQLSGPDHLVGGAAAGAGNVISGNGQGVILFYATNCIVQNNLLGPDARGTGKFGTSSSFGVSIADSSISNLITGNTISGNSSSGILVHGNDIMNNRVVGNNIGADVNGAPLGNYWGITVHVSNNEIGGTNEADGNLIAFNAQQGIVLTGGATNCPVRKNRFVANGLIAIDLGDDGVTANDDADTDVGANERQNYPVIGGATIGVSDVQITGYLQSSANQSFELDFYANAAADPTGYGEGEQYLGSATVVAGADGRADFSVTFPKVAVGRFISATATDSANNTSEFSASFRAASTRPVQSLLVTTEADSGPGSLRQALIDAGKFHGSGPNKITFNIPGAGLHVINVLSQLPTASEPMELDGFTQPGAQPNTAANIDNAVRLIQIRGAQLNGLEDGLRLTLPGCIVRGLIVSEFPGSGILLDKADNSLVEGSLIVSNRTAGIYIRDTIAATIGGAQAAVRNIIYGNLSFGIYVGTDSFIVGSSAHNRILGNFIGVDTTARSDTPRYQSSGIMVYNAQGTQIGGIGAGEGNLIAFNDRGVTVRLGFENRIRGNSIYSNNSLAIDLDYNGVSQNDAGDADSGANNLQNFPVLQSVNIATGGTHLIGALNSAANSDFIIDLYNNDACDLNSYGEGARYITSINIRTDATGNTPFDVVLPVRFPQGVVTATATDAAGNTSEFSSCVSVGSEIPALTYVVTNTNDSGPGSLRQAIHDANNAFTAGRNTIAFNISGSGIQTISPVTPLPNVTNAVYINGFTQPGAQPNTSGGSVNATLLVRIDGAALGGTNFDGVRITGNDVMVRGLIVTRFSGAGIAVVDANNVVVTECFLGVVDSAITGAASGATPAKKINFAASDVDPDAIYKIYGNRIGLRVDGGKNFSSAPPVAGIVGLLVAGNTEQGAIFTGADTASLLYAYFEYNGGLDPTSGAIRLRGTTGALLEYLWLAHNDPNGIAIENAPTNISDETIIRNSRLRYNSRPAMGAAIKADRVGFNLIESNLIRDNFNDGILIKHADGRGLNRIYGNMLMFEGGAGIFLDESYSVDIGGSLPEQKNSISLNQGGGVISFGSAANRWLNNIFGLANTPRIVSPPPSHGLTVTRTTDSGDAVITISGHGAPNQTVEIAIYKALPTPVGAAFDVYETITADTDGSGDFTSTYRKPVSAFENVEIGVMACFGFLDSSEMSRAVPAAGQTGNFAATLIGPTTIQTGVSAEYTAAFQYTNPDANTFSVFNGALPLPIGVAIESTTMQTATNSSASYDIIGDSILISGNLHAGASIAVKIMVRSTQPGFFDMNLANSIVAGGDSDSADNNAHLQVQVVTDITPPALTYSFQFGAFKLFFDADAKLESTTDLPSGQWQRIETASPITIDPKEPFVFFRAVRP